MMHAAERPCTARPSISSGVARLPEGARPTNSEPTMLSTKPSVMIRMRPNRSARPPITTMKMPENSAVIATALFMVLDSIPRSRCMSGATFSVVWANSQNVTTPRMIPKSKRSLPWNPGVASVAPLAAASGSVEGLMRARSPAHELRCGRRVRTTMPTPR